MCCCIGHPNGRVEATSWVDSKGTMWLFGGRGIVGSSGTFPHYFLSLFIILIIIGTTGLLDDYWSYSISSNEWVWRGDSLNNEPPIGDKGGREGLLFWSDSARDKQWMFGGISYDFNHVEAYFSDFWIHGNNFASYPPVHYAVSNHTINRTRR